MGDERLQLQQRVSVDFTSKGRRAGEQRDVDRLSERQQKERAVGSGGRHIIGRHIRVEREVKLGARLSEGILWVWLAYSYDAGCCVALVLPPAALSALQMRGRRAVTMAGWQAR